MVVGQGFERGQGRPGEGDREGDDREADRDEAEEGGEGVKEPAHEGRAGGKKVRALYEEPRFAARNAAPMIYRALLYTCHCCC